MQCICCLLQSALCLVYTLILVLSTYILKIISWDNNEFSWDMNSKRTTSDLSRYTKLNQCLNQTNERCKIKAVQCYDQRNSDIRDASEDDQPCADNVGTANEKQSADSFGESVDDRSVVCR